jgi:serine/threonine protein kinase
LPAGTRFGELEIVRVVGVGGFGIVYLARDHSLERDVALKEYMPSSLASRGVGPQITVRSGSFAETYAIGLRSFVNEARLLARFDHPSLVKVYRFWEANATAYMVMPYLPGQTLREARRAMTQPPSEAWVRGVIDPILGALDLLHREGVFHRDIAPDNIVLRSDGRPVLLDFGAARHVISDRTQSLTAILKPSYAPIEQYAEMVQLRQGPWTDLYALGAVIHFLLFGAPPSPATARAVHDDALDLELRKVPGVSARFLAVLAWMLAVRPQARPQNVAALRAALEGRSPIPAVARQDVTVPGDTSLLPVNAEFQRTQRADPTAFPATQVDATYKPKPAADAHSSKPVAPAAPPQRAAAPRTARPLAGGATAAPESPSKRGLVFGGVTALMVLAGAAIWQLGERRGEAVAARGAPSKPAASSSVVVQEPQPPAMSVLPAVESLGPPASGANLAAAAAPAIAAASAAPRAKPAKPPPRPRDTALVAPAAVAPSPEPATPVTVLETPKAVVAAQSREQAEAAAPAEVVPATAREACGKRVYIALAVCMERECQNPRYRDHPQCVKVLAMVRRRERQ